jgi:hypothetical protein
VRDKLELLAQKLRWHVRLIELALHNLSNRDFVKFDEKYKHYLLALPACQICTF